MPALYEPTDQERQALGARLIGLPDQDPLSDQSTPEVSDLSDDATSTRGEEVAQFDRDSSLASRRFTNATWRLLEEQRIAAIHAIEEIDTDIAKLRARREDAVRVVAMCDAGQRVSA